jgi:hypothetical protein
MIHGTVLATVLLLMSATAALADGVNADGDGDFVNFGVSAVDFGEVCRDHSYTEPVELAIRRAGTSNGVIFKDSTSTTTSEATFGFSAYSNPNAQDSGNGAQTVIGAGVTLSAAYRSATPRVTIPIGWGASAVGTTTAHTQADTTLTVPAGAPLGDPNPTGSNGTTRWNASGTNRANNALTLEGFQANHWTVIDPGDADCNRAPTIAEAAFTAAHATCAGATLALSLGDRDLDVAGSDEDLDVTIAWGDGTTTSEQDLTATTLSRSHTYASAGRYTATIAVTDQHGATVTARAAVAVDLATSGVLEPMNADGSSVFKAGSTVPLKIRIADCDGWASTALAPTVQVVRTSGAAPVGGIEEAVSTSAADTGTTMRFSEGQWIYNLSTKSLSDTTARYRLEITVALTGQTVSVGFGLR